MKTASSQEIKEELKALKPGQLVEICLRLARFKKENKELLTYLLFESHNEEAYITSVKEMMDEGFTELPKPNLYLSKKTLRKILRQISRCIKYAGSPLVEASLLLHFCRCMQEKGIPYSSSTVLNNLYQSQLKKIHTALDKLHEDIQYDLRRELEGLEG